MNCHYINDKKAGLVLIPGCMGTAVYGIERCTCKSGNYKSMEERVLKLEQTVKDIRKEIKNLKL